MMKALKTTVATAFLAIGICNQGYSQPRSQGGKPLETEDSMMNDDHLKMKDGKMMVMKDGKSMMMSNGDSIMMDGKLNKADEVPKGPRKTN